MSTLTTSRTATPPRVNLLPPEIGERARFRKVQSGLALAVLSAAGLAGLLYFMAVGEAGQASRELDATRATTATLQAEAATYAEVPRIYTQVAAAEAQLTQAMGQEIRWSYYLNDLSLRIPEDLWLDRLTVTQNVDATTGTLPTAGPTGSPPVATVTFEGTALEHVDVAAWLRSLLKMQGNYDPYFTRSDRTTIGDTSVVDFDSSVSIDDKALSGRYSEKAGS